MNRDLRINHLHDLKTMPAGIEINFSFSNMMFLLDPGELPFDRESIVLHAFPGDARVGSRHLLDTLSRREGVPPENVFLSLGASMANYFVWASLLEPGDEVLIEFPVYEPMYKVPQALGMQVRFWERDPVDFSISCEAIEAKLTDQTRMIVLSDSHNPSGGQISQDALLYLAKLSRERGIHVLIDEVFGRYYRRESLFVRFPEFIVTSSLSKYYGLGSLRIGWAFAPAAVVERARNYLDFVSPEIPITPLYLAHLLLEHPVMETLEERITARIRENRELVIDFLGQTDHLTTYIPKSGLLFFPQVKPEIDIRKFYDVLRAKYKMAVTEGFYFQTPDHFRMSAILDRKSLESGLARIESALRDSRR